MDKRERFIEKAHTVHGNKYDYSKVEYYNCKEKNIKQDFSPCFLFCQKWLC